MVALVAYYEVTKPASLTQTNEFSHQTFTAILGENPDLRILTALFAVAIVGPSVAWFLTISAGGRSTE